MSCSLSCEIWELCVFLSSALWMCLAKGDASDKAWPPNDSTLIPYEESVGTDKGGWGGQGTSQSARKGP